SVGPVTDWQPKEFVPLCCRLSGCYGFWCCPCLACTVSGRFGENSCLPLCDILSPAIVAYWGIPLCAPPAALSIRAAMRNRYGIKGSLCKDIAISCFCDWCSWCQMHRELKERKKTPIVINATSNTFVSMQPPPVVMQPAPVVMQPPPVVMQPPPVVMMPANPQPAYYVK
uniref:Protein PLANT CADMIUM RESISTANCE 9-like n=1 Tax=Acanthochromis polyacanthus TaxID=80966 RepID=A0A3Q1GI87_9TELE